MISTCDPFWWMDLCVHTASLGALGESARKLPQIFPLTSGQATKRLRWCVTIQAFLKHWKHWKQLRLVSFNVFYIWITDRTQLLLLFDELHWVIIEAGMRFLTHPWFIGDSRNNHDCSPLFTVATGNYSTSIEAGGYETI